jgi:HPt (histidine-containing phosphotransfer) domain-containing protein
LTSPQRPVPPPERMASVLSSITAQAQRTNRRRAAELRAALDRAGSAGLDDAGWAAVELTAHQLAGSAGTFGYAGVSALSRTLEQLLVASGAAGLDPDQLRRAQGLLDEMAVQLEGAPDPDRL